jgi:hypothetical protein
MTATRLSPTLSLAGISGAPPVGVTGAFVSPGIGRPTTSPKPLPRHLGAEASPGLDIRLSMLRNGFNTLLCASADSPK